MGENDIAISNHWLVSLADLDEQQKYIASLKPDESYIVEGCAGSGKSVLAMIKFNQLCQNGKSPIYATMMRGLTDTIITEILNSTDEGMKEARNYVYGTMTPPSLNRISVSNRISESLKCYSKVYHGKPWYYKCKSIGTLYQLLTTNELCGNALVVDECQDLSYSDFCKIVQQKGVYNPICWYGDDNQQLCDNLGDENEGNGKHVRIDEIHEKCFPLEAKDRRYKLVNNYRISRNVARFIDEFQKIIPEERGQLSHSAQGRRTDRPYLCGYESWTRQIESLVEIIKNRKWQERTGHRTAIFVGGKNAQVEEIYAGISKALEKAIGPRVDIQRRHGETGREKDDWMVADPDAAIIVSSPLSSKGCQFDSVFVLVNTFGKDNGCRLSSKDLNAIHVAMTRSCGELFVFYVRPMPPAFDQIPTMLYESSVIKSSKSAEDFGLR